MKLVQALQQLLSERRSQGLHRKKAEAAIKSILEAMGDVDLRCLSKEGETLGLGSLVTVPGDDAIWIITGEYCDGSFDIMREGGMDRRDFLVGWCPGESVDVYFKLLVTEAGTIPVETGKTKPSPVRPLFTSATAHHGE